MMWPHERQYDIISVCFAHKEVFTRMVLKVVFQIVSLSVSILYLLLLLCVCLSVFGNVTAIDVNVNYSTDEPEV